MQWVLAGVSLAIILICGSMITSPILYSAENASSTAHHADPSLISRTAENRAGSVVPAMDNLIESTGTIVLNIKNKDFKAAQADLEAYMAASRSFNSLVVNLDLSESEIGEFVEINRENMNPFPPSFDEEQTLSGSPARIW